MRDFTIQFTTKCEKRRLASAYKTDPQILLHLEQGFWGQMDYFTEFEKIFPIYRLENEKWSKEVHLEQGSPVSHTSTRPPAQAQRHSSSKSQVHVPPYYRYYRVPVPVLHVLNRYRYIPIM